MDNSIFMITFPIFQLLFTCFAHNCICGQRIKKAAVKLDNDIMKMLLSKGKGKGTRTRVKSTFFMSVENNSICSCCFLWNIAACAGLWACAAFWCAGRGWQVL